jgi:hypothetical protein
MWKTVIAIAISVSFLGYQAIAEEDSIKKGWAQKPIQCDTPGEILEVLKKYNEQPIIGGMGVAMMQNGQFSNLPVIWFFNKEKDTWTLVEWNMQGDQACILASGSGSKFKFEDLPFLKDLIFQLGSET